MKHTPYKNPEKLVELAKQRLIDNSNFGWKFKKIVKLSENKEILKEYVADNVAVPQQNATASNTKTLQHATLQSVAVPQRKKPSLFGRVLNAVFNED